MDVQERIARAQMLVERGALDEATAEYETIWKETDTSVRLLALKHGLISAQIAQLALHHPPARAAFTRIRNAAAVGAHDWVTLNRVLGETERTLSWYEANRDRILADEDLAGLVQGAVIPLLVEAERWADAGRAFVHPKKIVEMAIERKKRAAPIVANLSADEAKQVIEMLDRINAQEISVLRRALAAAGRDDELRAVDEIARTFDPSWVTPSAK